MTHSTMLKAARRLLTRGAHKTDGPVPEQKTKAAAQEQAAKRAALLKRLATLPEHLRLGVTLAGMRALLSKLPSDAVEQVNANIPLDKKGEPKYPTNDAENGYVNQYFRTLEAKVDGLAVCERLQKRGSPHVGEATAQPLRLAGDVPQHRGQEPNLERAGARRGLRRVQSAGRGLDAERVGCSSGG